MGIFSTLFGGRKKPDPAKEIFSRIGRVLSDEQYQLELVSPELRAVIQNCPAYDRDPSGTGPFGRCETNPIPVNGPIGELAYLSRLVPKPSIPAGSKVGRLRRTKMRSVWNAIE